MSIKRFNGAGINSTKSTKIWDQTTTLNDFQSIATIIVPSGGQSTVTFNSIPQTYTHLQLRYSVQNTSANYYVRARFNSDSTAGHYMNHYLNGNGSSASASAGTVGSEDSLYFPRSNTSYFSGGIVDILDYSSTVKNKVVKSIGGFDANGTGYVDFNSGLWMPASLSSGNITRIDIDFLVGNHAQYSQFALYGIKVAS